MTFPRVIQKPGPVVLAASLALAGFSAAAGMPAVTDACGRAWPEPSELQVALAIAGGEASGHAWAWHVDEDGGIDYGAMQVKDKEHREWFGPVTDPAQLNWANYSQNAQMAYAIYVAAKRKFTPWQAFVKGYYLAERYAGRSWMDWAGHGVSGMAAALAAGTPLEAVASINLDPLRYW